MRQVSEGTYSSILSFLQQVRDRGIANAERPNGDYRFRPTRETTVCDGLTAAQLLECLSRDGGGR